MADTKYLAKRNGVWHLHVSHPPAIWGKRQFWATRRTADRLAPATVAQVLAAWKRIFRWGLDDGRLRRAAGEASRLGAVIGLRR